MSTRKFHFLLVFFLSVLTVMGLLLVFPQFETTFNAAEKTKEITLNSSSEKFSDEKNSVGKIEITTNKEEFYTGEQAESYFILAMNQTISGSVIEIRLPSEFISKPPEASPLNNTSAPPSITLDENTEEYVIRYEKISLEAGGSALEIPFKYTVKNHRTPRGYKLPITGTLISNDNTILANTEKEVLYTTKLPNVTKYVKNNSSGNTNTNNVEIVIGEEDPDNPGYSYDENNLDKLWPVQYQFRYVQPSSGTIGARRYDSWKIVDKLPEGALFVQEINPDWVYDEETREATFYGETGITVDSSVNIFSSPLKLYYPKQPINDSMFRITNVGEVTMIPEPGFANEETVSNSTSIIHKSIPLVKANKPLDLGKTGSLMFDVLEEKQNKTIDWKIAFKNPTNPMVEKMENITIHDYLLDERLEYKEVFVYANSPDAIEGNITLIAILDDGSEVVIDDDYHVIDNEYKAPVLPLPKNTKEVILKTNPGTKLVPPVTSSTNTVNLILKTKIIDPENTHMKNPEKEEYFYNNVKSNGEYENDGNKWEVKDIRGGAPFRSLNTTLDISKVKREGRDPLYVNDVVKMETEILTRSNMKGQKIEQPVLMDLLPVGFDYVPLSAKLKYGSDKTSFEYEYDVYDQTMEPEVIPNYQDTGRTALIWELPEFTYIKPEIENGVSRALIVEFKSQVTSVARDGENIDEVFLAWKNNDKIKAFKSNQADDIYDLNGNGETGDKILFRNFKLNYSAVIALIATKEAKGNADTGYVFYPRSAQTEIDSNASYRLSVLNNTSDNINNLRLLDVLPHKGDKTVGKDQSGQAYNRESEYDVLLKGPIEVPTGFTAYYSSDKTNTEDYDSFYETASWEKEPSDFSEIRAIKIEMNENQMLKKKEMLEILVPVTINKDYKLTDELLSNNSFGVSTNPVDTTLEKRSYFESNNAPMQIIRYKVSGNVFHDADLSGKLNPKSPGISQHEVTLVDEFDNQVNDLDGNPIKTQTNSQGYYELEVLREGKYRIKVVAPSGYTVTEPQKGDRYSHIFLDGKENLTDLFEINERHKNIIRNAGYYREEKPITIFKYDGDSIKGINDDEIKNAKPLENAVFEVYEGSVMDTKFLLKDEVGNPIRFTTDTLGETSFNAKLGEEYLIVEVKSPQGFELLKKPIYVKNVDNLSDDEVRVLVANYSSSILPHAGGENNNFLFVSIVSSVIIIGMGIIIYMTYPIKDKVIRRKKR